VEGEGLEVSRYWLGDAGRAVSFGGSYSNRGRHVSANY
jgi:hypothetical protein